MKLILRLLGAVVALLMVLVWMGQGAAAAVVATSRVSVSSAGVQGNGLAGDCAISANGRFVAFDSQASNLIPNDTNGAGDVFLRDRSTGTTRRVSLGSGGVQGNGGSHIDAISGDGRFVVFTSDASNLVPTDTNGTSDVFVRDRSTGTTSLVSVSSAGVQGDGDSSNGSISADGRFVAFISRSSNLVPNDTNTNTFDVFVRDRSTGTTRRVSVSSAGAQGNSDSYPEAISADGRFVAFTSYASNLVPNDTNGAGDVFVRNLLTSKTSRVSVSSTGAQGNDVSFVGSMSADGRYVAFASYAANLIPNDTNGVPDVFVRDRSTGTTRRVSLGSGGVQGNDFSGGGAISADGRYVVFSSWASNLVPNDTNGVPDVFVRDRSAGTTRRVSVSSTGVEGTDWSYYGGGNSISADVRFVAFYSYAPNLVPNDTNGVADVFVRGPLH